jgi:hypothetical protein
MVTVELTYTVEPFGEGRYFVMPQFPTGDPNFTTAGDVLDEPFVALKQSSGSITIAFPAARVWKNKSFARPFALHFVLNEWIQRPLSHIIARTTPVHYAAQ